MTLATEKVQGLLSEEALKAVRERSRCTGEENKEEKQEEVVSDRQERWKLQVNSIHVR